MGHYDECYEADEEIRLKKKHADLVDSIVYQVNIKENEDEKSIEELELILYFCKNISFFNRAFHLLNVRRK